MQRREFIKYASGIACAGIAGCSMPLCKKDNKIAVEPTESRLVNIYHRAWDMKWVTQFPEAVNSREGVFMTWPKIYVKWEQISACSWGYQWSPTPDYVAEQEKYPHQDLQGNPIKKKYILGLVIQTEIRALDDEVALKLTLRNESDRIFTEVRSDGGCFGARSEAFQGHNEVARSFIMQGGKMVSIKELPRTNPVRCAYYANRSEYDDPKISAYEWFWGRSNADIETPVIVGAVATDGGKAVAYGWEKSFSALANSDDQHHCLHSCPSFGDIKPQTASTRRGYILFGKNLDDLAWKLQKKLTNRV
jgi:hypothetical protein